ncbi:MAG: FAD:protein FMN transferase [Oscillospiraceae bacterium]|nr:FAD:protein FMN transferase [Oscillospiraceae bacterium]
MLHIHYSSAFISLCLVFILFFSSCSLGEEAGFEKIGFSMGSAISSRIYAENEAEANSLSEEIFAAIGELDSLISATDENSEISALNAEGEFFLSEEAGEIIRKSLDICEKSNGRLNIALGAVTKLWGFSTDLPSLPDEKELKSALGKSKLENILIDGSFISLKNGAQIDLGAVGKGAGADEAERVLQKYSCSAVISFGGTVLLHGKKPGKENWVIGVRDPFGSQNDYIATLSFSGGQEAVFISTSGSYEKTFTENGKVYHHIIDPETGFPVQTELVSVTAVSNSGLIADALSTALFAEGLTNRALELANEYSAGAVFIFEDGRIYVSGQIKDCFEITNTNKYTLMSDEEIIC